MRSLPFNRALDKVRSRLSLLMRGDAIADSTYVGNLRTKFNILEVLMKFWFPYLTACQILALDRLKSY